MTARAHPHAAARKNSVVITNLVPPPKRRPAPTFTADDVQDLTGIHLTAGMSVRWRSGSRDGRTYIRVIGYHNDPLTGWVPLTRVVTR